jgi:ABC-2 type transport system permease protein
MNTATRPRVRMVADAFRAELIKLLTLPQLRLTMMGSWIATVVLDAAFVVAAEQGQTGTTSTLDVGLAPIGYVQAGFIVFGVFAATSEYVGGQIRTSLIGVPRRMELQVVKGLAVALATVPVAALTVAGSVLGAQYALDDTSASADVGSVTAAVTAATAYLVLTTLLAFAVGTLMRQTLSAVAVLLGYYFIIGPLIRDHMPHAEVLPDTAGYRMWFPADGDGGLTQAQGSIVVLAWTLLALVAAAVTFQRRDA